MKATAIYIPESPEQAARFFGGITELKAGGSNVSVSFNGLDETGPDRYSGDQGVSELLKRAADYGEDKRFHVVISNERFSEIREVSKPDLLVVAGGGATLGGLREAAASEGLFLPFDQDLFDENTTLAQLVMNGAASRWESGYGGLRESILSLGIVTPSGDIIHSGSHSVKDVAGYEITGFVSGAGGRCGMIHSITMRLLPRPRTVSFLVFSGDPVELEPVAKNIFRMVAPVSTEIYHGDAAKLMAGDREIGGRSLLISEIHLPVQEMEKQLLVLAGDAASGRVVDHVHGYQGESGKSRFISKVTKHFGEERLLASLLIDLKKVVFSDKTDDFSKKTVFPDKDDHLSQKTVFLNKDDYLSWTGYFPMRGHYIWAVEDHGNSYPLPRGIEGSIRGNIAPGARVRFELLRMKDQTLLRRRLPVAFLAGSDPDLFREVTNGEVISGISEKIYSLFDPERIILA